MEPASSIDSMLGFTLVNKYRIVRRIGHGGMGVVYEAEHVALGKAVAIKLMLEKYAGDAEAVARFQREALAASRIGNPHIIDVKDIGTAHDGRLFVVMELLDGAPLSQVLQQSGPMPPWRAIHIMRQVLRAVGAAHAKGIVHRDLKPDNIFLVNQDDHHDFVKLLDFGISKMMDPELSAAATKLTTTGVVMGTPLYMAPEQAMGNPVDHRADIYACGVILYELLAGRPPFDGATYAVLVAKLLTATPPFLGDVRPGLPDALVSAVHRALGKEPEQRFSSAEVFAASLPGDRTPSLIGLAGTLDSGHVAAVKPPARRARWPWFVAVAAVAMAAAGFAVVASRETTAPATNPPATPTVPVAAIPEPTLAPPIKTGTLDVKSNPPGAAVSVDGAAAGTTPLSVSLPPGPHHLHVELAGHTSLDEDEEVRGGERTSVVVALPQAPAAAAAVTKPVTQTTHAPHAPPHRPPPVPTPVPAPTQRVEIPPRPLVPGPNGPKPNPY